MKDAAFLAERTSDWDELDGLLRRAKGRPERLGADGVLRVGELYRAAAADLAVARRALPQDPARRRLEDLVARGRQAVYADERRRARPLAFFARGFWRAVGERPGTLALATALFALPALLATAWALSDPDAALTMVPGDFRQAVEPVGDTGMSRAETAVFSGQVLTNNIQVALMAFALGITAGLGTAVILAYNGVILGVIAGGAIEAGNGITFLEFVFAHGVLELSLICVAGAAGLRLGWALVSPGRRTRAAALVVEGRRAIAIAAGTVPWFVLAGLIEGFVTRSGFGLPGGVVVGVVAGGAFWALMALRGRSPRPAAATTGRVPRPAA
ncbi:MAG TPA: stage II sporulation protein M [Solirubrobacteraceae bacterium]|nr:stage II sporulation protein M [Solirubrobacteraceae bacterium]